MKKQKDPSVIYLDNAATSWPKPPGAIAAMCAAYAAGGVSPGRSSHRLAREAEARSADLRRRLGDFFGGEDPERVVFCHNATQALNTLLLGVVRPGMHIVSSVAEHNSVLRPLHHLQQQGLASVDFVPLDDQGVVAPAAVAARLRPETGFVILNHVSNVTGLVQPVAEIAAVCRRQKVPLFLDASQSAGVLPIDMQALGVSALAFTGHKSLLGPTGIGGLVLTAGVDPAPTRFGGTGFDSRSLAHPAAYPFRLEAGTLNILGILGLHAGLDYIAQAGRDAILTHERMLAARLITGLGAVPGVRVHYAASRAPRVGVVSCELENTVAEDAAEILDGEFRIAVRAGLHCAPLMHRHMGTERHGTLRFSVGPFTTLAEIDQAVTAVTQIAAA